MEFIFADIILDGAKIGSFYLRTNNRGIGKNRYFELCCGLRFLNFNASEKLKQSGGGGWSGMRCNETDSDLCHWLTKPSNPGSGMFAGGFSRDDLNGTSGNQIATKIGKQLDLNGDLYGFLLAALFLPPWLPEKTANACLFLRQLCDEISKTGAENKLPGEYADDYEAIKRICKKLIEAFPKLIKENNHGLLALAHNGSKDLSPYKVEQQFDDCFDFLKEYLPDLIESLEHMKRQSGSWTAENIKNVRTQGPFLYGFTFTDKCKPSNIESQGQSELTQAIEDVLRDLLELNQILNPTSHAVAIGLGVVSSLLILFRRPPYVSKLIGFTKNSKRSEGAMSLVNRCDLGRQ
ncbi:secreted antigen 1 [Babesia caballi]|uniref:Secreted antigen 1 n=1 Tax=Babesia caballi TaxID=5871 RepID=A0AAV4M1N8_BABCB|nr:secreted antigen 1 [Babesia caballi]